MGRDRSEKCAWGVKSPGLGVGVRKRAEAGSLEKKKEKFISDRRRDSLWERWGEEEE